MCAMQQPGFQPQGMQHDQTQPIGPVGPVGLGQVNCLAVGWTNENTATSKLALHYVLLSCQTGKLYPFHVELVRDLIIQRVDHQTAH